MDKMLEELRNWEGVTPAEWKCLPARYCVSSRSNGDWGEEPKDDNEGQFCLRAADFDYEKLRFKECESLEKRSYSKHRFSKVKLTAGDLLVEKSGGGEKVPVGRAVLYEGKPEACFSNFLERVRVKLEVFPKFFLYWWTAGYQSRAFSIYFNQTTGIQNLNSKELLAKCSIALPAYEEQQKIAQIIDHKRRGIDESLATLEGQISTLERYRASVIHEAVTHGLDPAVPTKPSGVDWIGSVPLSWDVKRLKFILQFFDHLRAPIEASLRSQEKETLYPYYGASGAIDLIDDYNVEGEMILIGEDGANLIRRTLPLSYIATGKYWVNNHAHILRPIKGCLRYYYYALEACDYTDFITGSAQPKLSQQNLSNVWLPQPTPSEQLAIADYLDARTAAIDAVLDTKRKQLDVLKRRRQSLIYEYVTGKRRVNQEA